MVCEFTAFAFTKSWLSTIEARCLSIRIIEKGGIADLRVPKGWVQMLQFLPEFQHTLEAIEARSFG